VKELHSKNPRMKHFLDVETKSGDSVKTEKWQHCEHREGIAMKKEAPTVAA